MGEVIKAWRANWDKLSAILEELYGMIHSLNDYLGSGQTEIAKKEAADIEKEVVKALDVYNEIDSS